MHDFWKTVIWEQYGAAIDALSAGVRLCPDALWLDATRTPPVWGYVHHAAFWLDVSLSGSVEAYTPPDGIGLEELDPEGVLPATPLSRERALEWLGKSRAKTRAVVLGLTEARSAEPCTFTWGSMPFGELLLYNLRHVQHHAGQLNWILRQEIDDAPRWSFAARGRPPIAMW